MLPAIGFVKYFINIQTGLFLSFVSSAALFNNIMFRATHYFYVYKHKIYDKIFCQKKTLYYQFGKISSPGKIVSFMRTNYVLEFMAFYFTIKNNSPLWFSHE